MFKVTDRFYPSCRNLLVLISLIFLVIFIVGTWRWPLVGDAPLLHYVVFLTDHGMLPYRDIVDPNMPGTYFIEAAVMHLFGGDSLTWRIFDFALLLGSGAAMLAICIPYDWFAGVFAATIFTLIHGRDGLVHLGQRDMIMALFLLAAYVSLFRGVRSSDSSIRRPYLLTLFGLCIGCATTIKPTAALFLPPLLLLMSIALKRRKSKYLSFVLSAFIAWLVPCILVFAALAKLHLVHDFLQTVLMLVPALTTIGQRSFGHLFLHTITGVMLPLVILWLPIAYLRRSVLTFERVALFAGIICGLLSFYLQKKGFPYHRYPSEELLLVLIGIDVTEVLRSPVLQKTATYYRIALAALFVGILAVGGGSLVHALGQDWHNQEFSTLLQGDLDRLGGPALSGQVQCMDMWDGCIPTLYNMGLVQATGVMYDCYMLAPAVSKAAQQYYRREFWDDIMRKPPTIFIITSDECGTVPVAYKYQKLHQWPQFEDYLKQNYSLEAERIPPHMVNWGSSPSKPLGYRLYLRKPPLIEQR